jgi:hypothetical protein
VVSDAQYPLIEYLIALALLSDAHPDGWTTGELHEHIGYRRRDITDAVGGLTEAGVAVIDGSRRIKPSHALVRIEALDMICV